MTQEEIERHAEEYVIKTICKTECPVWNIHSGCTIPRKDCNYTSNRLKGYIDSGKWKMEHATNWHDLRENPEDLPNPNIAVLICFRFEKWTTTYIAYYRPSIKKWQIYNLLEAQREPIVDDYIDSEEVIAWCELPKFKE